jgi:hypothetical protein
MLKLTGRPAALQSLSAEASVNIPPDVTALLTPLKKYLHFLPKI